LTDYWDGNWLIVDVACKTGSSETQISGSFLRSDELSELFDDLVRFQCNPGTKTAKLKAMEPYFGLEFEKTSARGALSAKVEIRPPTAVSELHRMTFQIDQSYLPEIIKALGSVVQTYPVKGRAENDH